MSQFPIVPSGDKPNQITVWADQSGKPYLVQQKPGGEVSFTPLENALAQTQSQQQQPATRYGADPMAVAAISVCIALGITLCAFFIGFLSGNHGREMVVVPRSPICRTTENSFLFWNSRREDCK